MRRPPARTLSTPLPPARLDGACLTTRATPERKKMVLMAVTPWCATLSLCPESPAQRCSVRVRHPGCRGRGRLVRKVYPVMEWGCGAVKGDVGARRQMEGPRDAPGIVCCIRRACLPGEGAVGGKMKE